ncbi:MAG: type IV secretion system protein [Alphaproteobacteria bacterium]|nr:type IV secretion system protein [Alphaproteobacteria bacterium]
MTKRFNIKNIGRMLIMLLAVVVLLSACGKSGEEKMDSPTSTEEVDKAAEVNNKKEFECWQGKVFNLVYDAIGSTVVKQYDYVSQGSMSLMMIAFAVWLALRLLKFVSSVTESSPSEMWNEIIKKAFICMVCASLASSSEMLIYTLNFFLLPIYGAFLEFGSQILELAQTEIKSIDVFGEKIHFEEDLRCAVGANATATTESALPSGFGNTMNCMVCALSERLKLGESMAYRATAMEGFLPVLLGLLVWAIFFVVRLLFVFYLVDSVFRFGIIILMLPIFILAYAFGPTKKWTKIGFSHMMYSAVYVMAFSILIATVLMAIANLITENGQIFNPADPDAHFQQISIATLCLLLIGCLVWKSLDVAQELASSLIGAQIEAKLQQNLKAVGSMVLSWVTGGFGSVLAKAGFYEKTKLGRFLKKGGEMKETLNKLAGRPTEK